MVESIQEGEGEMEREDLEASPSFFIENLLEQGSGENNEMSENSPREAEDKLIEENKSLKDENKNLQDTLEKQLLEIIELKQDIEYYKQAASESQKKLLAPSNCTTSAAGSEDHNDDKNNLTESPPKKVKIDPDNDNASSHNIGENETPASKIGENLTIAQHASNNNERHICFGWN